jgi:phosphate transport system substrate-binding protein
MTLYKTTIKRVVTTGAIAATLALGSGLSAIAQQATLNGAGATFPEPLYQRYSGELRKANPPIQLNYQGIGSGGGVRQFIAGSVDFGASDNAMTDEEAGKVKNGVVFVPTAGGPVAVVYNLPGVDNLKLSRQVLPAIFAGQITNWNDPKIAADNQGVTLPNQPIRLAVRADASGTSFIFSNALSAMDSYFKGRIGTNRSPSWPGKPLSAKGNPGVTQIVQRTRGSIGYVESTFADQNKLQTAQVQNQKKEYVAPTLEAANQALETVKFNPDFRVNYAQLGNPSAGYPITGLTWIMVYKNYQQPGKAPAVKRMVQWMMNEGQQLNDDLGYTRIPASVTKQVVQAVNSGVQGQ